MKPLIAILLTSFIISSCGNNAEEKDKEFQLKSLEDFIKMYSDAADEFCKCLTEKSGTECEEEIQSAITIRKAADAPLLICTKKEYLTAEEAIKKSEELSAITDRITACMNDTGSNESTEESGTESAEGNTETEDSESTDGKEIKTVKTIKEPKVVPVEEEEEHHHDDPY